MYTSPITPDGTVQPTLISSGTVNPAAPVLSQYTYDRESITSQPVAQVVAAGNAVSFTASADGNPAPSVQWQVSTDQGATYTDIPGATSATLSFTTTAAQNGNQYRAVFTSSNGTATTAAATLTVATAPVVTTQPDQQVADSQGGRVPDRGGCRQPGTDRPVGGQHGRRDFHRHQWRDLTDLLHHRHRLRRVSGRVHQLERHRHHLGRVRDCQCGA